MSFLTVGQENSEEIRIFYEDHGAGAPVVLIHGFPLNGRSWEKQERVLLDAGYRVITYDRRGFGQSSQPSVGYDYDTFASDLKTLMDTLDLHDVTLVGFSMGTGEVTRYLAKYKGMRARAGVLCAPIPPFLLRTEDNPEGVEGGVFSRIKREIRADRYAFLKQFFDNFYNVDPLRGTRVSDEVLQASFNLGASASAKGTYDCVDAWLTDFREDLPEIDVPLLVIQGDDDRILPIDVTGRRLEKLTGAEFVTIKGGPHAICWTHAHEVNEALLTFLERHVGAPRRGRVEEPSLVH
jgi:non-heme chloroperoxidase